MVVDQHHAGVASGVGHAQGCRPQYWECVTTSRAPPVVAPLETQRSAERNDPLLHAEQSHAGFRREVGAVRLAVVSTVRTMSAVSGLDTQLHVPGVGVFRRIGDRLLRDAIEIGADAGRQIVDLADDGNVKSGAALLEAVPARNEAFEAEGEAEFLDVGRTQAHQRAAQRFHHAAVVREMPRHSSSSGGHSRSAVWVAAAACAAMAVSD